MRGHVLHVARNFAVDDAAVGRFDKAERIDLRKRRERGDQADVRTFGCFDRADTTVVCTVNVTNVETGALPGQAPRSERRDTAFVTQFRERVDLILKLAQLATSKKLTERRHDRAIVNQLLRGGGVGIAEQHPFAYPARHPAQTDANLIGDEFTDGADAAVAEVVDIVFLKIFGSGLQVDEVLNRRNQPVIDKAAVFKAQQCALLEREPQLGIHLVTPGFAEIVTAGVSEQAEEVRRSLVYLWRVAGAEHRKEF